MRRMARSDKSTGATARKREKMSVVKEGNARSDEGDREERHI